MRLFKETAGFDFVQGFGRFPIAGFAAGLAFFDDALQAVERRLRIRSEYGRLCRRVYYFHTGIEPEQNFEILSEY